MMAGQFAMGTIWELATTKVANAGDMYAAKMVAFHHHISS
jgi:hypothetical protein